MGSKTAPVSRRRLVAVVGLVVAWAPVAPVQAAEPWPAAVNARYKLKFNGIDVGSIAFTSKTTAQSYALSSTGQVAVLFGAIKWTGTSSVEGRINAQSATPQSYTFDWKKNSKGGAIRMKFAGDKAVGVSVEPPASTGPEVVPVTDQHKQGVLDPMSAIMALTRAGPNPCDRKVPVFDGKHRFNIVFSHKRTVTIPPDKPGGSASSGIVCRAVYEPIAGHKANADSKAYAANKDAEVLLREISKTGILVPYSVTVPSAWGTGSMVAQSIEVTNAQAARFSMND